MEDRDGQLLFVRDEHLRTRCGGQDGQDAFEMARPVALGKHDDPRSVPEGPERGARRLEVDGAEATFQVGASSSYKAVSAPCSLSGWS